MARFVGILKDKNAARLTKALLEEHVGHLRRLKKEGLLLFCGPLTGQNEALQMLLADSFDMAQTAFLADPFLRDGFYAGYTFSEFIEANDENNYLMDDTLQTLK